MRALAFIAAAPLLAGCMTLESGVERDPLAMPAAYEYMAAQAEGQEPDPTWWTAFGQPELDALEAQAMEANNNLKSGLERVIQARASLRQSRAVLFPSLSGSASSSVSNTIESPSPLVDTWDPSESSSARLSASYEVDLFGANAASIDSAEASLASQIYSQRALELSIQANVANTYFNLLSLQERLDTAIRNLEAVQRVSDLVQRQYDEGAVSGFDLSRQRSAVATARATIPSLEQQIAQNESALALLLGVTPESFDAPANPIIDIFPPEIDAGLPPELLFRRPDLMQAEAGLAGAEANIVAARAAFLPGVSLSAGLNGSEITPPGLLASIGSSLGASISQTIFDGGRRDAALESSQSRYRALVFDYQQAVLTALKDVEDALVALETAETREELQRIAAEEAQRAFDLSEARYEAGADDLLSLIDAQRQLLTSSDSLVQARQARLNAAVGLFAALGGGWTPAPETLQLTEAE